ncbi:mechanosensitive ion channel family protein [Tunturibacter empetritectus]|uniref:Small conductance mechanosensitive channel n=1 Tax=Tunturiibacter empetritectus TaxID=3069691 RepID=A0A7W8IEM7_9BACT|nr:mechanosensitive ion channel domain-containing protein [Edaphobacter lichenicola]MBB5315751.1 small conductance mechanosensitive channel [Edaphobacter lichenicola]
MLLLVVPPQDERIIEVIQHDWHNDIILFLQNKLPKIVVVLLVIFVLQRFVLFFVKKMRTRADRQVGNFHRAAQLRTIASIVRATSYGVLGFIAFLQLLNIFDIPYQPILASAGIVGVGIGLGAQSIFKDMLNGIFILIEDQYNVGEVVALAGLKGTVEDLSLRSTRLRDADGTLYIIPNSQIANVANLSRDYAVATLPVSVDASANPDKVIALLTALADDVRQDSAFKDIAIANPVVLGVDKINGREITYPIQIRVRANQRDGVLRELRRRIILAFEKEGIPLGNDPANMLIIRASNPTGPPAQQPLIGS